MRARDRRSRAATLDRARRAPAGRHGRTARPHPQAEHEPRRAGAQRRGDHPAAPASLPRAGPDRLRLLELLLDLSLRAHQRGGPGRPLPARAAQHERPADGLDGLGRGDPPRQREGLRRQPAQNARGSIEGQSVRSSLPAQGRLSHLEQRAQGLSRADRRRQRRQGREARPSLGRSRGLGGDDGDRPQGPADPLRRHGQGPPPDLPRGQLSSTSRRAARLPPR